MWQIQDSRMTPENFVYWLQGMLEGNPNIFENGLSVRQANIIQDHLDLVLNKVTPDRSGRTSENTNQLTIDFPTGHDLYAINLRPGDPFYNPHTTKFC